MTKPVMEKRWMRRLSACFLASLIALAGLSYPAGAAQIEKGSVLAAKIEHRKKARVLAASGKKIVVGPVILAEGVVSSNESGGYDRSTLIPWTDIRTIQIRKNGAGRGALIGGGVGAGLGLMAIAVAGGTISAHGDLAKVMLYPVLTGLVSGALLGARFPPWKTVYAAPTSSRPLPRVFLMPTRRGGMMLNVSLSF